MPMRAMPLIRIYSYSLMIVLCLILAYRYLKYMYGVYERAGLLLWHEDEMR